MPSRSLSPEIKRRLELKVKSEEDDEVFLQARRDAKLSPRSLYSQQGGKFVPAIRVVGFKIN